MSLGHNNETINRECENRVLIIVKIKIANFKTNDYSKT